MMRLKNGFWSHPSEHYCVKFATRAYRWGRCCARICRRALASLLRHNRRKGQPTVDPQVPGSSAGRERASDRLPPDAVYRFNVSMFDRRFPETTNPTKTWSVCTAGRETKPVVSASCGRIRGRQDRGQEWRERKVRELRQCRSGNSTLRPPRGRVATNSRRWTGTARPEG